jgi:hypothetical protein
MDLVLRKREREQKLADLSAFLSVLATNYRLRERFSRK